MPTVNALARDLIAREGTLVIAHRGASADAPENTLPAFRRALADAADLVELDYHHTKNGEPYVLHDKTLDRTTDAVARWGGEHIALAEKTDRELRELDAGAWFHARFRGTRIPHLGAALDVIQRAGGTALIERKSGDAETLVALLVRRGALEHVVVQSFDWRFLLACRKLDPRLVLVALGSKAVTAERLAQLEQVQPTAVGWSHEYLDAAAVKALQGGTWKLWAYTVDDPQRALELKSLGVAGIITNRPATIRAALAAGAAEKR